VRTLVDVQAKQSRDRRQGRRWSWRVLLLAGAASLAGCAAWDDVTSKEFTFKGWFAKPPDPLTVLRDDTDGDHRAKALRSLQEPKAHGGTDTDQTAMVQILATAAASERSAYCRLAAIQSLSRFKDPRAAEAIKDAYYRAGSFNPDTANIVKCQALNALGETGNPSAVELLVKVLREPPVEGPDMDRQQKMDERIAAARALGHFKHYQATEALVGVLRTEPDVALRNRATESLEMATGKHLPADATTWENYLHQNGNGPVVAPEERKGFGLMLTSWWK
jgi:hypothetical protein